MIILFAGMIVGIVIGLLIGCFGASCYWQDKQISQLKHENRELKIHAKYE